MSFKAFPRIGTNDPELRKLSLFGVERQTGLTGVTLTLTNAPTDGSLLLFKNGTLLDDPTEYTVAGRVVTLGVAAVGGDIYRAKYHFAPTGRG